MDSRLTRRMLKSKIHHATVTEAELDYEGSVTIDATLMNAADILEYEEVHVWNVTRGTRLATYAIRGEPDSGVICINGAAAHLVNPGDRVIIATFTRLNDPETRQFQPRIVLVDESNRIRTIKSAETAGVRTPRALSG